MELDTGDYAAEGWRPSTRSSGPRLALVGTLEQPYKGHDTAISAVRILASRGFEASLAIAGSGKYLSDFQRYASEAGIIDSIQFAGVMGTKARLWEFLGNADILLVPSRAEGLPRVLLEGMARGLPCVGSNVGGIPELLEPDFLITPGDSVQLADRIQWLWTSPGVMIAAGRRNLEVAKQHHRAILEPRRRQFYSDVARLAGAARSRAHTTHLEDE